MELQLRQLARYYYDGKLSKPQYRQIRRSVLQATLQGKPLDDDNTRPLMQLLADTQEEEATRTRPREQEQTDTQRYPQAADATNPPAQSAQPPQLQRKKTSHTVTYLLIALLLMLGMGYFAFMQTETETAPQISAENPPLLEQAIQKSAEQVLAESLIQADEWEPGAVDTLMRKMSAQDYSSERWYRQLKQEVQTRLELVALEPTPDQDGQQHTALKQLAAALDIEVFQADRPETSATPEAGSPEPAEPVLATVEDGSVIFPGLEKKPPVAQQTDASEEAVAAGPATTATQPQTDTSQPAQDTPDTSQQQTAQQPTPETSASTQPAAQQADPGTWELDLIVRRGKNELLKQQQTLKQRGIQATVTALQDKPEHWRLYIGGFASKTAAQSMADKIQRMQLGYDKPWVKRRKAAEATLAAAKTNIQHSQPGPDTCNSQLAATRRPYCKDQMANGETAPQLVVLPGGSFTMGDAADAATAPQRKVTVAKPFAITQSEITYADYQLYCRAAAVACPASAWKGQHPVTHVSWHDAVNYAKWLSQQTGQTYRLPSEAEWEYACRGNTTTAFPFQEGLTPINAHYAMPNGSPRPLKQNQNYNKNGFHLYHIVGNVREWVQDTWHANHASAPNHASPRGGDSNQRVVRGGSYQDPAAQLRSAARLGLAKNHKDKATGFRLVRELRN